jgi:hypothetical protein
VVRTVRDLAYNIADLGDSVDPLIMKEFVKQYNDAPHSTLTDYGPGFAISPNMVQLDPNLEEYINRRISQDNMNVRKTQGFELPIGSIVLCFNDISPMDKRRSSTRPEGFVVLGYHRGVYRVRGMQSGVVLSLPRWKLKPFKNKII